MEGHVSNGGRQDAMGPIDAQSNTPYRGSIAGTLCLGRRLKQHDFVSPTIVRRVRKAAVETQMIVPGIGEHGMANKETRISEYRVE